MKEEEEEEEEKDSEEEEEEEETTKRGRWKRGRGRRSARSLWGRFRTAMGCLRASPRSVGTPSGSVPGARTYYLAPKRNARAGKADRKRDARLP